MTKTAPPLGPEGRPDRDDAFAAKVAADNFRAKSDALLKRCGCDVEEWWEDGENWVKVVLPNNRVYETTRTHRPFDPFDNAQDAIDLAGAMGLKILNIQHNEEFNEWDCTVRPSKGVSVCGIYSPTIAEAICAAIAEAVGKSPPSP